MALGDPPKKKPVVQKEYDDCWVPYPDNPKEIEINTIDGKLRSKPFDPFEDIARRAKRGEFDEPTDIGIDTDENSIIWDDNT